MKRLIEKIVFCGFVTCWRFAGAPTSRWPSLANATTDGVVRPPSAFGITAGSPPSITATQELVVPRSIPIVFAIALNLLLCSAGARAKPYALFAGIANDAVRKSQSDDSKLLEWSGGGGPGYHDPARINAQAPQPKAAEPVPAGVKPKNAVQTRFHGEGERRPDRARPPLGPALDDSAAGRGRARAAA
jgi:hypothetical protein